MFSAQIGLSQFPILSNNDGFYPTMLPIHDPYLWFSLFCVDLFRACHKPFCRNSVQEDHVCDIFLCFHNLVFASFWTDPKDSNLDFRSLLKHKDYKKKGSGDDDPDWGKLKHRKFSGYILMMLTHILRPTPCYTMVVCLTCSGPHRLSYWVVHGSIFMKGLRRRSLGLPAVAWWKYSLARVSFADWSVLYSVNLSLFGMSHIALCHCVVSLRCVTHCVVSHFA